MPREIANRIGSQVDADDLPEPVREAVPEELLNTIPPELLVAAAAELGLQVFERAVIPLLKKVAIRRALTYAVAAGGAALALKLLVEYLQEEEPGEMKALPAPESWEPEESKGRRVPID